MIIRMIIQMIIRLIIQMITLVEIIGGDFSLILRTTTLDLLHIIVMFNF
jgi:hypothetical protein